MNRFACVALALVLLQVSHAMATTITIATDAGTVKIERLARDIDVDIKGNGDIDITDQSTGSKVLVRAGEYKFELKGNKNDTKLEASDFQLLREGKPILRITSKQTVRPKGTQSLAKEVIGWYQADGGREIDWANGAPHTNGWIRAGASGKTMLVGTNWEDELTLDDKEGELQRVGLIGIEFIRTETE